MESAELERTVMCFLCMNAIYFYILFWNNSSGHVELSDEMENNISLHFIQFLQVITSRKPIMQDIGKTQNSAVSTDITGADFTSSRSPWAITESTLTSPTMPFKTIS